MNVVVGLLSHHCHVRLQVKIVASSAIFVCAVVLECEFRKIGRAHERAQAHSLGLKLRNLGESVAVVVVAVAHAVLTKHKRTYFLVVAHHRGIQRGVVIQRTAIANRSEHV